jgi:hypothetical protein
MLYNVQPSLCHETVFSEKVIFKVIVSVTNPTVYNRSIYKYNLIDVYKYNHMLL